VFSDKTTSPPPADQKTIPAVFDSASIAAETDAVLITVVGVHFLALARKAWSDLVAGKMVYDSGDSDVTLFWVSEPWTTQAENMSTVDRG